jgi:hypothetical protein
MRSSSTPQKRNIISTVIMPTHVIVADTKALLEAAKRIASRNDMIIFKNVTNEFRLFLRCVDADDELCMDTGIIFEAESETESFLSDVITVDSDLVHENEGIAVYHEDDIPITIDTTDPRLTIFMNKMNELYASSLCSCGSYLIKDGKSRCVLCELSRGTSNVILCPICQDEGSERCMVKRPCCGQYIHNVCWRKYMASHSTKTTGYDPICPLCRCTDAILTTTTS